MRLVLRNIERAGRPPMYLLNAQQARLFYEMSASILDLPEPPMARVEDLLIPMRDGQSIKARLFAPYPKSHASPIPTLVYFHGGGFTIGSIQTHNVLCRELARIGQCAVISVDYRLAPEYPYPTPLEDCYAGLAWVHQNAESLGIDATRIGIGGASAGAGLAAGLALLARDRGDLSVAFQLLIYPMIDDRQITVSSTWSDPIWSPAANTFGWTAYLGDKKGTSDVEPYAAPARATDLSGLPPTLISVGALDGFSDEDIDYAVRLRHAGVAVELHVYPGAPHGFDTFGDFTAISRRAIAETNSWLQGQIS